MNALPPTLPIRTECPPGACVCDRDALLRHARTPGQRCEAHFYEAMLRRLDGDVAGSLEDLRAVVATDVLRYFEYELAWEMLQRATAPVTAAPAGTATATPPPTR